MKTIPITKKYVEQLKDRLPIPDCKINEIFIGCNEADYLRKEYCKKNCNYRCLNGRDYKKIYK